MAPRARDKPVFVISGISLLLFLSLLCFTSSAQEQKLYLDPKAAINTSIGQLFEPVEFIPLETNKQSLFSRASAMAVTDQYYIIFDQSLASVLFFDRAGKYVSLFKAKNEDILDMQYVRSENTVLIRTQKRGLALTEKQKFDAIQNKKNDYFKVRICNLNIPGNFDFEPLKDFSYAGYALHALSGKEFLTSVIFARKNMPARDAYELEYVRNNRVAAHFFPYNQQETSSYYNYVNKLSFFNSAGESTPLFVRPYRYNIYAFENDRVDVRYKFIFPAAQSLPADFFTRDLSNETAWEVLRKQYQGAVQNILPVLSWKNHLAFWLGTLQPNNMRDLRQYILDIDNQTLINARTLAADSVSYQLSINMTWLMAADDTSVYTFMFTNELSDIPPVIKENLPASLQIFLEQKTAEANPIIVRLINKQ